MVRTPGAVVQASKGFALGGAIGTVLAALDFARGAVGLGEGFPGAMLPGAIAWCASAGALAGVVTGGCLGVRGVLASRWTLPTLVVGAAAFAIAVAVNATLLPAFASPISLAADALIVVLAGWCLRAWGRRGLPAQDRAVHASALICLVPIGYGVVLALGTDSDLPELQIRESRAEHPNVLLVVVDTLRADHTSLHEYERPTTPNLDRFAGDALIFGQTRSSAPWTIPSVGTLLTGLPPLVHTAHSKANRLPDEAVTLAEVLSAAGYRTGMFSDNPLVCAGYGFDQGFDHVDDRMPEFALLRLDDARQGIERWGLPRASVLGIAASALVEEPTDWFNDKEAPERGADGLTDRFLDWLGERSQEPWLGYLHYMEPHTPYAAPAEWEAKFVRGTRRAQPPDYGQSGVAPFRPGPRRSTADRDLFIDEYDAEIAYWDHAFGRLLNELSARGVLDDTVLLVTSDHGEGFYEHGVWRHHNGLYDELLRVPMVLRIPGQAPGRCDLAVSQAGVLETLVSAAGFTFAHTRTADPLLPLPDSDSVCRAHFEYGDCEAVSIVENGIKWILSQRANQSVLNAYDLARDPGETRDLAPTDPDRAATMKAALLRHAAQQRAAALDRVGLSLSDGAQESLRGLGYIR